MYNYRCTGTPTDRQIYCLCPSYMSGCAYSTWIRPKIRHPGIPKNIALNFKGQHVDIPLNVRDT